ncbi:Ankyrin repeat protein 1 [Giardia duodenalis]|uniref:Ankyrin repeat protein 1 n=1 Tax=Giardia intestinalis (strain ATCC 50803 / WB clone C6) TaxID=184922 RepID=A8B569_GIAIC|nr:Ankyrin repeat protein 1 [Giardia intestinalis]KAE8303850.1 Ankyrin repeat protein 1 [Giardia intestinalis]|eukprot:XP_001709787.1 Hypothetical protein GL50803_32911 [Giardia lamblia ATCC 50803]
MAILLPAPPTTPLTEADEHGRTTLMRAIISNDRNAILSHAPFEWGWADVDGYTALMHAVQADNIEAVKLLTDFEYPFTLPDTRTALMLAIKHRRYRLVPLMTERLSRLTNRHGYNALMYAVTLGDLEMIRVLIASWPSSCMEDLLAANDVVDLGPVDARDAISELLKISIERLPDVARFSRRVLCMGVIPKKAIPNHANGVYPIDIHFHEENASWRETEAQLCETIKLLHTKIEGLESNQLKGISKCVSRHVSVTQEHKSICLQTPFDWGSQSWTLAKLLSKLDSKQRKIAILEEELQILQGKDTMDNPGHSFFKEASDLRIKERTLKERIAILERAMDEHIGIINGILGTSCQSLMEVESSVKSMARTEVQMQDTAVPTCSSLENVNTRICSPMTVIQEVNVVATGCDKGTDPETSTVDAYAQAAADENSMSDIASFRQQLNEKEALLDKICSVVKIEEGHADGQVIVSAIDRILKQNASLQSDLKSASEKLLGHCTKSALLHNLLKDTGVDSIEALATYISTTKQELAQYRFRVGNVTSSDSMQTAGSIGHDVCNNEKSNDKQASCQYFNSGGVDPAQVSALLRQLSSYTQRPCTTVTDAMHLIHEYCVRAASESIALQKTRDDVEREHSIARSARAALADQEAAYNALINKHTVLLNDAQHLAMKYNDLGKKYNDLYAAHEQLQRILAATRQRAIQHQSPKSVRFADTVGPVEKAEHENNDRLNGDQLQIPITVADAACTQITYEVSADRAGHIRRAMSVDDAKKFINQQITKQKTRSQSTTSNSPLYPAWNCCTSADISKWLRRPLFVQY